MIRRLLPRPLLASFVVLLIELLSSAITAVVAALMLVEGIGLMGLSSEGARTGLPTGSIMLGIYFAVLPIVG